MATQNAIPFGSFPSCPRSCGGGTVVCVCACLDKCCCVPPICSKKKKESVKNLVWAKLLLTSRLKRDPHAQHPQFLYFLHALCSVHPLNSNQPIMLHSRLWTLLKSFVSPLFVFCCVGAHCSSGRCLHLDHWICQKRPGL